MKNYDITVAASALETRVGFRQTIATKEYLKLATDLIADPTLAQQFVNSVSEYWLRVEALSLALEFAEGYDIDAYSNAIDYAVGDKVSKVIDDRKYVWVATQINGPASSVEDPETSPDFWESYLSNRLRQYRESVSREVIASAITGYSQETYTRELKQSSVFFKERTVPQPTQLQDRFVGVEIAADNCDVLSKILVSGKIGMYITGAQADVNVYFYHSSKTTAIKTYTIPSANIVLNEFKWYDLIDAGQELVCDLYDEDLQQGGRWYIGIYESELEANGQAYNHYETIAGEYKKTDGFSLSSIEIRNQNLNGTDLPTLGEYYDQVDFNDETPFNLRYEVSNSYYPLLLENIHIFDNVFRYKLAKSLLMDMMHSDRINHLDDRADAKIDEVIFGNPDNERNNGISGKISMHWKKLMQDMRSIFENEEGPVQGAI